MAFLQKEDWKLVLFCLVLVNLQVAVFCSFDSIPFNLALAFIFVSSSLLPIYQNLVIASILCILSSLLVYDMSIFWIYPLLAFILSKLNPHQIADKLIICIIFNIIFSPILELIYSQGAINFNHILVATLTNLAVSLILFFISKLIFKKSKVYN